MRPDLRLEIAGNDVTDLLRDRLVRLTLTDQDGTESDRLSFTLDNRNYRIPVPKKDELIKLHLGYQAALQDDRQTALSFKTGLAYMGQFTVNDAELSGPPDKITVSANAADMGKSLKSSRSQGWHDVLLGDLVKTVAARHDLTAVIADEYATIHFPHINQTEESDMHLLTRLCWQYDLIAKPSNGQLIIAQIGQGKAATGQAMPVITLNRGHVSRYRLKEMSRDKYQSIVCEYRDLDQAETLKYTAGKGKPVLKLRTKADSLDDARRRADAEYRKRGRAVFEFEGDMPGDVRIMAGTVLVLGDGWHPDHKGRRFVVNSATHTIDRGYELSFKGESQVT